MIMETQQRLWKGDVITKRDVRENERRKQLASKKRDAKKMNESRSFVVLNSKTTGKPKESNTSRSSNASKSLSNSLIHVDSRLASSMQVVGHHVRRNLGSASSCSVRERPPLQRRAHSSLGFTWNKLSQQSSSSLHTPADQPQGFDIAGYVKRCGTAQGIQIGINGRPVDVAIYLGKPENDEESCSSDSDENVDVNCLRSVSEGSLARYRVPLCWEEQLKLAEPKSVLSSDRSKQEKKVVIIRQQSHLSIPDIKINKESKIESIISKVSVTLSWRESCILDSTPLSQLNPSLTLPIAASEHNFTGTNKSGNTLSPSMIDTENQNRSLSSIRLAEWMEKTQLEEPVTPSIDVMSEFSSRDLLGIWFNADDSATQKELVKLSFEVFVTATETVDQNLIELSTRAFTTLSPQVVSKTVSVIPVHLCKGEAVSGFIRSGELKLTVICDAPRSMLFSTRINLSNASPPIKDQTIGDTKFSSKFGPSPRKHHLVGSLEVPEQFCMRRSSYCDQEEDEDKTDLEGLTRLFPDLKVLEYEDSSASGNKPTKPSTLPIHEDELMKLNVMKVKIKRTPFRLSPTPETGGHPEHSAVTNWTTYRRLAPYSAQQNSRSRSDISNSDFSLEDFAKRPLFRPVTQQDLKVTHSRHSNTAGYASIVSSRLTPYMK